MSPQRAATTRLEPGRDSIDRATPRKRGEVWLLDWKIRLQDGRLVSKRSQGPPKGQVRLRAKTVAEELLATGGGQWKTTSSLGDYLDRVSRPAVLAAQLRPNSRTRYFISLGLLTGECKEHRHVHSLGSHSISSGTRFRALESCLQEIAELHGAESARQSRTVLSKYVLQQLIRDEVITGNPLSGMSMDLRSNAKPRQIERGGQALSREQNEAVVRYLLDLDQAEDQSKPKRGRWSLETKIAKRRNAIDVTLLQAATGLRISEANAITWTRHVDVGDDGTTHVTVSEDISKTHRERRVPVLDDRVAERLQTRRNAAPNQAAFVIGSPGDSTIRWDRRNCGGAVAELYLELAEALDIDLLNSARTHVWRATLNSMLLDEVPEVIRAAFFGHDTAVNRSSYTDLTDTTKMVSAARRLRVV